MTKAQVMMNKKKKQKNLGLKNSSIVKNKVQKLQNTPTGKLALQTVIEGRPNGYTLQTGKSNPKKKKNKSKNKPQPVKAEKVANAEQDSENDESIGESDSDDEAVENKGLKMFKGMKNEEEDNSDEDLSDSEEEESSENDEEDSEESDEDDDEGEEEEDNGTPLKALLGDSIADDDDDDDFVNNEESDEDDDISDDDEDEEIGKNDSKESNSPQGDDDEDESDEESEESDEDEDEEENETPLKALLGDTIVEDDDDDDFVNNEESDDDDDISDDDDEEETGNNDSKDSIESTGVDEEESDDKDKNNKAVKKSKGIVKSKTDQSPNFETEADKKDRTIYVGNVPKDAELKDIKKLFRKFGVIESMRVRGVVAEDGNMSLKIATITKKLHPKIKSVHVYIVFKNESSAKEALKLNNHKLDNHVLRVDMATNKDWNRDQRKSVFLGNLSFEITEDELREHFTACGTIESVRIIKDHRSGLCKGIGYINFESEDSVTLALEFNGTKLKNREIRVNRSNPGPQTPKKKQGKKQRWRDRPNQPNKNLGKSEGSSASRNAMSGKKQKKAFGGQVKRGRSEENTDDSASPIKVKREKLETAFQGQKAASNKKFKGPKMSKKNKLMAGKLKAEKKND